MTPMPRDYAPVWRAVWLACAIQTLYAIAFIWRSSFVVEGERYFCLFDDAMISMRYAAHCAQGFGPVWNAGERVEGYTNFLWTAVMAVAHLPGFSPSATSLLMQIIGIPILWATVVSAARLAKACKLLPGQAIVAVAITAGQYHLIYFSLMGMETTIACLFSTLGLSASARALQARQASWATLLWFAPAALTRLDLILVAAVCFAFVWLSVRRGRGRLVLSLLLFGAVIIGHAIWRHSYYGDWLPNTYYLKSTGWPLSDRIGSGVEHTFWTLLMFGAPLLLALGALLRPRRWQAMLLSAFAILAVYQLYVGGDARPFNRFVLPAAVGVFVVAGKGAYALIALFMSQKTGRAAGAARIGLTAFAIAGMALIHVDHAALIVRPQTVEANQMNVRLALALQRCTTPEARLAVAWAGVVPYFLPRLSHDLLGRCEKHIARMPAVKGVRRAGHNKFDLLYSIATFKPDVVMHVRSYGLAEFERQYEGALATIDGIDVAFFVRRGSENIRDVRPTDTPNAVKIISAMIREQ